MIKVLLNGCNGKMGQAISAVLAKTNGIMVSAGISPRTELQNNYPVFDSLWNCKEAFDVIIDFSNADAVYGLLEFSIAKNKPLIIGTTGYNQDQIAKINEASNLIPVFISSNTSLGVNLLYNLVKIAASVLGSDFDIEIVEKHHNQKIDAPSGTAISIANSICEAAGNDFEYIYNRHSKKEKRAKKEIGIHSIRGGTITGEHSVIFAGSDEVIEIKHSALSKRVFAEGVIKIINFIIDKPAGLYNMKNVICI